MSVDYEDITRRNVLYMYRREFKALAKGNRKPMQKLSQIRKKSFKIMGLLEGLLKPTPLCLELLKEEVKKSD